MFQLLVHMEHILVWKIQVLSTTKIRNIPDTMSHRSCTCYCFYHTIARFLSLSLGSVWSYYSVNVTIHFLCRDYHVCNSPASVRMFMNIPWFTAAEWIMLIYMNKAGDRIRMIKLVYTLCMFFLRQVPAKPEVLKILQPVRRSSRRLQKNNSFSPVSPLLNPGNIVKEYHFLLPIVSKYLDGNQVHMFLKLQPTRKSHKKWNSMLTFI